MLKSEKKADPLKHFYNDSELRDVLIFRSGLDRPVKLRGNVDLISNDIDFELLGLKHTVPLESVDSVFVGLIPDNLKGMDVVKYVNGNLFDEEMDYYLELIEDGDVKLFKRTKVKIRRATYNKALAIGSKDEKYHITFEYFMYTENKGLVKVPKKNKSFLKLISSYKGAAAFFKKRKLKSKKEEDLRLLITYINKK